MSLSRKAFSQPGRLNEQDIYILSHKLLEVLESLTLQQQAIVLSFTLRTVETQGIIAALQEDGR